MDLENFAVEVYHAEENGVEKNIQAIPELKEALNAFRLRELGEKIVEQISILYPKKQRLEALYLDSKDVLEENLVFELMQKVADLFAPTVAEIKNHSPSAEELSLKAEDETGVRSEIYLKKSQVKEKLTAIKEKGDRLLEILGVHN
jgi:Mg2+ and Co2+ transporter CorA